ncbi:hypothetical protein [Streptomyces sp. NBC_00859]|uniref:hypothetical protein n=1 Tax=Streptomyces sp. NBC_00859 TaxID=2903682 RepID=UPI00386C1E8A|nr:hypothetical protein OG584_13975 [Streptomyces sp. NBC_00859]
MTRRTLPAAAALATAATLLLTACGGGDDTKSTTDPKIPTAPGSHQGKPTSAAPRPPRSASSGGGRPKFEFPADVSYVFDWPKTGNAEKDAVLADGEQFIKAEDFAIVRQDPSQSGYRFYTEGQMTASTAEYIKEYVKAKARITGTDRYYTASVELSGENTATLSYCEDQSNSFDLYLKTHKIDRTPPKDAKDNFVLYNTALRKNHKGVWVTTKLFSSRGSDTCRP